MRLQSTPSAAASSTPTSSNDASAATASDADSDMASSDIPTGPASTSGTHNNPSASTAALSSSPSSSSPAADSDSSSSGGGLTAGAAAGIAVGATLGVIALIAGLAFVWWRRRRAKKLAAQAAGAGAGAGDTPAIGGTTPTPGSQAEKDAALVWAAEQARKAGHLTPAGAEQRQEVPAHQIHEAPNVYSELDANSAAQSGMNSAQTTPVPDYSNMRIG